MISTACAVPSSPTKQPGWLFRPTRSEALVTHVTILAPPNAAQRFLRLKGLDAAAKYKIDNLVCRGDALMNIGLPIPYPSGDFVSCQWRLGKTVESVSGS